MADLQRALDYARNNPEDPRSKKLLEAVASGKITSDAVQAKQIQQEHQATLGENVKDFAKGVGKGVLNTVQGAAEVGNEVFGGIAQKIVGGQKNELKKMPEELTTPSNTAQKVGFGTEQVGEFLVPGGVISKAATKGEKVVKSAGVAKKIVQSVAKEAPSAITAAGISSAQDGKGTSPGDFIKNAILYGSLSKVGSGVSKVKNGLTKSAPSKLYDTAIKPTLDESRKAIKYGGKTLGQELIDRGIAGGDKKILNKSLERINQSEDALQNILKKSTEKISRDDIKKYLDPIIKAKNETPGLSSEVEKIDKVLNEFPKELTLSQANKVKRNLYNALRDVSFKLDPSLSTTKEAMKGMAKGIKSEIEKKTGGDVVKKLNQDLSVYGRAHDRVVDKLARAERNNLLGLGDLITGTVGFGGGGISGGIGLAVLRRVAGSTAFKTNSALVLDKIGKAIDKLPTDTAGNITKASLYKIIKDATD